MTFSEREVLLDVGVGVGRTSLKVGLFLKIKLSERSSVAVFLGATFVIFLMLLLVLYTLTVLLVTL